MNFFWSQRAQRSEDRGQKTENGRKIRELVNYRLEKSELK